MSLGIGNLPVIVFQTKHSCEWRHWTAFILYQHPPRSARLLFKKNKKAIQTAQRAESSGERLTEQLYPNKASRLLECKKWHSSICIRWPFVITVLKMIFLTISWPFNIQRGIKIPGRPSSGRGKDVSWKPVLWKNAHPKNWPFFFFFLLHPLLSTSRSRQETKRIWWQERFPFGRGGMQPFCSL